MEVEMARLPNPPWVAMVSNPAAALFVCAAAVLLWQGRKWGGYLLAAGAILPNVVSLAYGQPLRAPGLLMILAIITVAANWRQLR